MKFNKKIYNYILLFIAIFLSLILIESLSRVIFYNKFSLVDLGLLPLSLVSSASLDPYEMPSDKGHEHWVLRPGYQSTIEVYIHDKAALSKNLSIRMLKDHIGNRKDSLLETLRVNSDGFVGDELNPDHKCTRVLMLGDSVTFGSGSGRYPDYASDSMRLLGAPAEVVNGGVEGYAVSNLELEKARYIRVRPDIVTIMIGWNDLFRQVPWPSDIREMSRFAWLFDRAYNVVLMKLQGEVQFAMKLRDKNLNFDLDAEDVVELTTYRPPALDHVEKFAKDLAAHGMRVVLITLPSLLSMDMKETHAIRAIAHAPTFTDNLYVVAQLVSRYNAGLRQIAEKNGFHLFDAASWARENLLPIDSYFLDTVHLTDSGLEKLGRALGANLRPMISKAAAIKCGH